MVMQGIENCKRVNYGRMEEWKIWKVGKISLFQPSSLPTFQSSILTAAVLE
jgi:hypothetical protein